jgi:hypothetical protein
MELPRDVEVPLPAYAPAAQRTATVFDVPVELVLVPWRRDRAGRATAQRPPFARSAAPRIVRAEAFWRADGLALTPNRYPFARAQRVLWRDDRAREPDERLWHAMLAWAKRGGAALHNTIGAAATIGRAHAHLLVDTQPFLDALPEQPCERDLLDLPAGVLLVEKRVPFVLLGLRGEPAAVATALVALAEARATAAWNVVAQRDTAWVYARSAEVPAPHFPAALGAAELWGRWCYTDAAAFATADGRMLERALVAAGVASGD